MIHWLTLGTEPEIAVYPEGADPAAIPGLPALAYPWLTGLGARRSEARIGGSGESSNLDAEIMAGAWMRAHLLEHPTGWLARVQYLTDAGEVRTFFRGRCESVTLSGGIARLALVASGLIDPLALRSTTAWPTYRTVQTLPLVIGECRLEPIPYDAAGLWWLLADHPIAGVDEVRSGERPISAYALHQQADPVGRPVALLELAEAPRQGERLAVRLRGLPDLDTGALLTSPADVAWYLLRLGGQDIARAALADFRHACQAGGLEVHGVFREAVSVGQAIARVMASAGAVWSADMPGWARLWPLDALPATEPVLCRYDWLTSWGYQHTSARSDLATVLRVAFDYDDFSGQNRQALTLEAPDAIREHGRIEREVDAGMLRSARLAAALGTRLLRWYARARWQTSVEVLPTVGAGYETAPGSVVQLLGDEALTADPCLLADSVADIGRGALTLVTETAVGPLPRVVQTQVSAAVDGEAQQARVEYASGVAEIRVTDEAGRPVAGAVVMLGTQTQRSDGAGIARFAVPAGTYSLRITYPSGQVMTIPDYTVG